MNIELQVGKRYERVGGQAGECVEYRKDHSHDDYPFAMDFGFGKHWYTVDGRSIVRPEYNIARELPDASGTPEPAVHPDGEPVRVITDEQAAATLAADRAAEPASDTQAPLRLEVGKFYRARNGEIAEVLSDGSGKDEYHAFRGRLPSAGTIQWSADGRYWEYDEDEWDLIEEVTAPVAEAASEMEFEMGPVAVPDGPATEKVVAHWDRERFIGIEADVPGESPVYEATSRAEPARIDVTFAGDADPPAKNDPAIDAWFRTNVAHTRADITRKYAQAAMFVLLGVAAIIFAIGTSVQA